MTLEEAQEQIVNLQNSLTEVTNERDTLKANNQNLTSDLTRVRELNQRYFEKLSAQYVPPGGDTGNDDHEEPTCEEFARTLKI